MNHYFVSAYLLREQPERDIATQSDGMFNNPLYSGIEKTPFQPATQCSYSVVENETKKEASYCHGEC